MPLLADSGLAGVSRRSWSCLQLIAVHFTPPKSYLISQPFASWNDEPIGTSRVINTFKSWDTLQICLYICVESNCELDPNFEQSLHYLLLDLTGSQYSDLLNCAYTSRSIFSFSCNGLNLSSRDL
jgi:hypothetical protein